MDEAETKALTAAAALHSPPTMEDETRLWHIVQLPTLGHDFVSPPMSAEVGLAPKVIGVQWHGNSWVVILHGQWTEAITLDSGYNLVSMKRVRLEVNLLSGVLVNKPALSTGRPDSDLATILRAHNGVGSACRWR